MFMKRKLKSDRGFTLAELLIVVAIIGVLVAIAIPIFTSQLERSREAVDLSDVRSAYAEVMMAAITGDTSATYTKTDQKIYQDNGDYYIKVTPLKQQKNDWQTPLPITIGGAKRIGREFLDQMGIAKSHIMHLLVMLWSMFHFTGKVEIMLVIRMKIIQIKEIPIIQTQKIAQPIPLLKI